MIIFSAIQKDFIGKVPKMRQIEGFRNSGIEGLRD
jgi:hypothetical protein